MPNKSCTLQQHLFCKYLNKIYIYISSEVKYIKNLFTLLSHILAN
jgi:hypothetical protein